MTSGNPYTPPATEPSAARMEVADGSLWRVEDGGLLVRERASLPDVCIYGSPPEEPGRRRSVRIHGPRAWIVLIMAGLTFARMVLFPDDLGIPWLLGAATIIGITSRQVRVMVFEGSSSLRRRWIRSGIAVLALVGVIHVADEFFPAREILLPGILGWSGFWFLYGMGYWYRLRAVSKPDAWYEIRGIAPSSVARLAEIQQDHEIRQDSIRNRMKR